MTETYEAVTERPFNELCITRLLDRFGVDQFRKEETDRLNGFTEPRGAQEALQEALKDWHADLREKLGYGEDVDPVVAMNEYEALLSYFWLKDNKVDDAERQKAIAAHQEAIVDISSTLSRSFDPIYDIQTLHSESYINSSRLLAKYLCLIGAFPQEDGVELIAGKHSDKPGEPSFTVFWEYSVDDDDATIKEVINRILS